jgi:hypothetical protein
VTGGTLDLNGHLLTANELKMWSANESLPLIKNGGRLNLELIGFDRGTLTISPGDVVTGGIGHGGTLNIETPLTLDTIGFSDLSDTHLFADLSTSTTYLGQESDPKHQRGGKLHLNGHTLYSRSLDVISGNGNAVLDRGGGQLSAEILVVERGGSFFLDDGDSFRSAFVKGPGSTLTLHRSFKGPVEIQIEDGGTLNTEGHDISMALVWLKDSEFERSQGGNLQAAVTAIDSKIDLLPGDELYSLSLTQGSAAIVRGSSSGGGVTLGNPKAFPYDASVTFDPSSILRLVFPQDATPGDWLLRWVNSPWTAGRTAELQTMHDAGNIVWNFEDRVQLRDGGDGYTYVVLGVAEPGTSGMAAITCVCVAAIMRVRRKELRRRAI